MAGITIADIQARHARLTQDRKLNLDRLAECEEREHGFKYVLGELELMIEDLAARDAAAAASAAAADLTAFAEPA